MLRVSREHSGILLKEKHIACFKVNWNDKPTNIKLIADELNIGTNSMVFVDASIQRRTELKRNCSSYEDYIRSLEIKERLLRAPSVRKAPCLSVINNLFTFGWYIWYINDVKRRNYDKDSKR